MIFQIVDIRGEYAYLRPLGESDADNDLMVAMALLPFDADIGSKVRYFAGEYTSVS